MRLITPLHVYLTHIRYADFSQSSFRHTLKAISPLMDGVEPIMRVFCVGECNKIIICKGLIKYSHSSYCWGFYATCGISNTSTHKPGNKR